MAFPTFLRNAGASMRRWYVPMVVLGVCSAPVMAQSLIDSEIQRQRAREEAEERSSRQQAPSARLQAESEPLPSDELPVEANCFKVERLVLAGDEGKHFAGLGSLLDAYRGRCVGKAGLNLIVKRLTARLVADGYVTTRVGLPEQDLVSGTLTILVVPGRVRSIRFKDEVEAHWENAFPVRPGDLLNLRDVEQGLEQMKRLPSQDVDIAIAPGGDPGESDLVLTVKRSRPWRIGWSLDDAGATGTGRMQTNLSLSLDGPLGLNDLFSLSIGRDAQFRGGESGTRGQSLQYSVPWGYWTLSMSAGHNEYHQLVRGTNQNFLSSGESDNQDVRLQRVVHRDQSGKTSLQFRVTRREQHSYIEDAEILVQRRTSVAAEVALQHRQYLGASQLDMSLAQRHGMPWFDGMNDKADLAAGAPTFRYVLNTLDVGLLTPFSVAGQSLRWNLAFHGQYTGDTLYSGEQMAIGNRYTVRGFDGDNAVVGERGWFLRNDLDWPLAVLGLERQTLFLGLDYGQVGGPSAARPGWQRLSGAVLGMRGGGAGFSYEFFAGKPLQRPDEVKTRMPVLGFQLSWMY